MSQRIQCLSRLILPLTGAFIFQFSSLEGQGVKCRELISFSVSEVFVLVFIGNATRGAFVFDMIKLHLAPPDDFL